jgi:hypothetical protein
MNVFLWILQIILAGAFGMAGLLKLIRPKEKLTDNMAWAEDFTPGMIKFIGGGRRDGARGLILPAVTGIATVLTPLAATGLVIVMIGAVVTHVRRKELPMVAIPAVLLILAAVVAWGRFGPSPL